MDIAQLYALIENFKKLPVNKRETTLFDVGSRGYFENPMTEVLSFFCDTSEVHNMKDLVVSSIVNSIRRNANYRKLPDAKIYDKPQREVVTKNNKRIDLLLSSDEWVIAIESKVHHQQVNPFYEYEKHVKGLISAITTPESKHEASDEINKQPVFVILSPDGKVDSANLNTNWCGVSFQQLVNEIKVQLQKHFIAAPFNKWSLILKDFLLHLENLVNVTEQNGAQEEFALKHLGEIYQAGDLLKNTLESVRQKTCIELEQYPEINGECICKKSSWFGLPTTILCTKGDELEVALFATGSPSDCITGDYLLNAGKHLFIQVHIRTENSELELASISQTFAGRSHDNWFSSGTRVFRWPVSDLSVNDLTKELVKTFNEIYSSYHSN